MQFVLPKRYWSKALEACHDNVGHLGIERMLSLLSKYGTGRKDLYKIWS